MGTKVANVGFAVQTIHTRYHGATNTKGARISATASGGKRIVRAYDHAFDAPNNHANAAQALAEQLRWNGLMVMGADNANGYVFVFANNADL